MSSDRLLDILSFIARQPNATTPQALAEHLNIPVSSVYRHLSTLKKARFISEGKQKNKITIGAIGLQMANHYLEHTLLIDVVKPDLLRLALKTQETAALMVPSNLQAICVEMVESRQALRCSFMVGKGTPLSQGASAKTLLAFMEEEERFAAVQMLISSQHKQKNLLDELLRIQKEGYCVSQGEVDQGIWGVSVPIFHKKKLQGVVTTMSPETRIETRENLLIDATIHCAASINEYFSLY